MLDLVRAPLLEEARRSPNLLSDLAGLEKYVAESYDARSFIELLQNADDAGAGRFAISRMDEYLCVANDGRCFSQDDFESLCRSAASSKHRGPSIGYRGIGFKSVVGFANSVYLISGDLETVFSRDRTKQEIPEANNVPLVRIPHPVKPDELSHCRDWLQELKREGFTTLFVFSDLIAKAIESEFAAFEQTSLLFLRSVRRLTLGDFQSCEMRLTRSQLRTGESRVTLDVNDEQAHWIILDRDAISFAFSQASDGVVRLPQQQAVVHAFLPTKERTGLGIIVNGDFSTDPSRTRIVQDERTGECIGRVADFVLELLSEALDGRSILPGARVISALAPYSDPRMASYQKPSFETSLLLEIMKQGKDRFEHLRLRPEWFRNGPDFESVARKSQFPYLPVDMESLSGLLPLLRSLGCVEAKLDDLSPGLVKGGVALSGASDVLIRLCLLHSTGQLNDVKLNPSWKIWPVDSEIVSLEKLRKEPKPLSSRCLDLLNERLGSLTSLRQLVELHCDPSTAKVVLSSSQTTPGSAGGARNMARSVSVASDSLRLVPRWRSSEQQVQGFLESTGWTVRDVSKQNLGYDLEGISSERETFFIEVKLVKYIGESITLTSNEEAVARENGTNYLLAIVHSGGKHLEIAFIADPANTLQLTRQCRQWVWVCDDYPFEPHQIEYA